MPIKPVVIRHKLSNHKLADEMDKVQPLVLTPEQRARLMQRSAQGLMRILAYQAITALCIIAISWGVAGATAALSAALGAVAYFAPNALFAVRLMLDLYKGKTASANAFFLGEFFKLGSALCILGLVVWFNNSWLVWPAFLCGLLGVLKGYVLLLASGKMP